MYDIPNSLPWGADNVVCLRFFTVCSVSPWCFTTLNPGSSSVCPISLDQL